MKTRITKVKSTTTKDVLGYKIETKVLGKWVDLREHNQVKVPSIFESDAEARIFEFKLLNPKCKEVLEQYNSKENKDVCASKYSQEINTLASDMVIKLEQAEKSYSTPKSWKDAELSDLVEGLNTELNELKLSLMNRYYRDSQLEAADVANYAMMIHDKLEIILKNYA